MHRREYNLMKAASGAGDFGPLLVLTGAAFQALGIGRTKGWELIRDGHLVARKIGARTLEEAESVRHELTPAAWGAEEVRPHPAASGSGSGATMG